jgi:hypothetical protein
MNRIEHNHQKINFLAKKNEMFDGLIFWPLFLTQFTCLKGFISLNLRQGYYLVHLFGSQKNNENCFNLHIIAF